MPQGMNDGGPGLGHRAAVRPCETCGIGKKDSNTIYVTLKRIEKGIKWCKFHWFEACLQGLTGCLALPVVCCFLMFLVYRGARYLSL